MQGIKDKKGGGLKIRKTTFSVQLLLLLLLLLVLLRLTYTKYLGTTLTNQNSIAEEIKSTLRSGSASYHSMQNLLSSRLLS